ncbi:uncharacterized protein LOC132270452 [Cornus florida]|uniref:uncharacterized protein LOC132270452 n=1 Tax=Cornus florida TaxID=4283 RepID=UPI00289DEC57|nr:uncharacterized protein LOC132270452 [Cornus florida]
MDQQYIVRVTELASGDVPFNSVGADGGLRYKGRLIVPSADDLRKNVMTEVHKSEFSIYPGGDKMYQDMKLQFWWAEQLARLYIAEIMKLNGIPMFIISDRDSSFVSGFWGSFQQALDYLPLAEFAYNNSFQKTIGIAPFEALYSRPYRSLVCWLEVGESRFQGLEFIKDTSKKIALIRDCMCTA